MPVMAEHMRALVETTGWSSLKNPDSAGVWRVSLEGGLDAMFFSLGDRMGIMRGVVVELPDSESESVAVCDRAVRMQMAALRERPSILTVEEPGQSSVPGEGDVTKARLVCFRSVPLGLDTERFVNEVQEWLNDLSWWKGVLGQSDPRGTDMNALFNAGVFSGLRL
ncbi:MAG: hypothetical protein J5861_02960 [Desulfovibrio sp.]|nr:hypothetical protein [Desulfovibrio sp.]